MPPKAKNVKAAGGYKTGAAVKDVLPAREKNAPLDGRAIKAPENVPPPEKKRLFESYEEIELWPGDEAALAFDFGLDGSKLFTDAYPQENLLTPSFTRDLNEQLYWRRPAEFMRAEEEEKSHVSQILKNRRRLSFNASRSEEPDTSQVQDDIYVEQGSKEEQHEELESEALRLFNIYARDETPEEFEARRKELEAKALAAAADKKGTKKGAAKKEEAASAADEGPLKLKDVKLSNIDLSYQLPGDAKWLASQLQLVKDKNIRDTTTRKPIWTKVFPQHEGVPVYNPSGRYWVKLYFMGQERKIEIDDRMPVNHKGQCRLPRSANRDELWACVLAKALLKLLALQTNLAHVDTLTGSGIFIYALAGLYSQTIPLQEQSPSVSSAEALDIARQRLDFVRGMLSDQHFLDDDVVVTCYSGASYQPVSESNQKRQEKDFYIDQVKRKSAGRALEEGQQAPADEDDAAVNLSRILEEDISGIQKERLDSPTKIKHKIRDEVQKQQPLREKPTYVIPGFAYPVTEAFFNNTFNMVYVQKRTEKEIKLRQDHFDLSKVSMHKMSKEEKLEHRRRKKELRERISEEDKNRIELITKPPVQYRLYRLKSNVARTPLLNIYCPYSNDEIVIAKKCILNRLSKPPNYELPEIRDDGKSVVSSAQKNQDDSFIMKPLDDFSSIAHLKEILNRGKGGAWIQEKDLLGCFQYVQIFYNAQKLPQQRTISVQQNADYELTHNVEHEVLILKKSDKLPPDEENVRLIFGFTAKQAAKGQHIDPPPFCILQKFDFGSFSPVYEHAPLQSYQSHFLQLRNQNNVFRLQTYSPLAFSLNIATDQDFQTCSLSEYLTTYEDFRSKRFTIEYGAFEAQKYASLFRFRLRAGSDAQSSLLLLQARSTTDNHMLKHFRIKLVEQPPADSPSSMLTNLEGVHKNLYEHIFILSNYLRIVLHPDTTYALMLEGQAPYNVTEGALELDFYVKSDNLGIEQIESVEPIEYFDRYAPTKYGILFRQKLYLSEDLLASFALRLAEVDAVAAAGTGAAAGAAKGAGGKGRDQQGQQQLLDVNERELPDKRLVTLELYRGKELLVSAQGRNAAIFSNVFLKANSKDEKTTYYLQATFDLREWEGAKRHSDETNKICWFLKVLASDTIVVVRDTEKEDREKAIQKSWEDKEPGRAAKAKKSREKFALLQKHISGQPLTEEEMAVLAEPRLSRRQREEEAAGAGGKGGAKGAAGKAAKKDEKKAAKGGKNVQEVVEKKEERPLPKSEAHNMHEITSFLQHMEQKRVIEQLAQHAGLIHVRSTENKREIRENALMSSEELTAMFHRNIHLREELKLLQRDQKQQIVNSYEQSRSDFKDKWAQYLEKREEIQRKLAAQTAKEREITEICKQERPTVTPEAFEKLINETSEIPDVNQDLLAVARLVHKNLRIFALTERINNALTNFEIEILEPSLKEVEDLSVKGIDIDLLERAEAMLEEARENPNFLAEKQAELKKQGKKGKK